MKKRCTIFCCLLLTLGGLLSIPGIASAQPAGTTNFYNNIKTYNLSNLWKGDQLRLLNLKRSESFPEPLGVLGKNYKRFYIHYTSVAKDAKNPYRYLVQGKTRIGNQIRTFSGSITLISAGIFKQSDNNPYAPEPYAGYKRGSLVSRLVINENKATPGSGSISGELTTSFCINAQNQLFYDTLDFGDEGYGNNQFKGTWIAYGTKSPQNLQFGDLTIMDSKFSDLDGITVPHEYEKYGWQSFVAAISTDVSQASKSAIAEEKRQWWK